MQSEIKECRKTSVLGGLLVGPRSLESGSTSLVKPGGLKVSSPSIQGTVGGFVW